MLLCCRAVGGHVVEPRIGGREGMRWRGDWSRSTFPACRWEGLRGSGVLGPMVGLQSCCGWLRTKGFGIRSLGGWTSPVKVRRASRAQRS
jgi:hypothetical protein